MIGCRVTHGAGRDDVRVEVGRDQVAAGERGPADQVALGGPDGHGPGRCRSDGLQADEDSGAGGDRGEQAPVQEHPAVQTAQDAKRTAERTGSRVRRGHGART